MDQNQCPECGTLWREGEDCDTHFYQMLFWENERPENGEVHHLMVLSFYLQHPSRYSPDGLRHSMGLLVEFVQNGVSPPEMRRRQRDQVDSGNRKWNITGRPGSFGVYQHPVRWRMTAADVVAGGIDNYRENTRRWAQTILEDLRAAHNLPV